MDMQEQKIERSSYITRLFHWSIGPLFIFQIIFGLFMDKIDLVNKNTIYGLHKSIGLLIGSLVILRVINRLITKYPKLPSSISKLEHRLAKIAVFLLYSIMILMPISGYLISAYHGSSIYFFGIAVPSFVAPDRISASFFSSIHETVAIWGIILISIHILMTIKHLIFDKINLIKRIW